MRIGTRPSPLALRQVEEVCAAAPELQGEIVALATQGDRDRVRSLLEAVPGDFFTDELDVALIDGRIDLAVHSAKDLPYPLRPELDVVALTAARERRDALVSRGGLRLAQLPAGAHVGTSSPARRAQLLAARPELVPVSIRGTIAERLAYVDDGRLDAVIVAACALERLGLQQRIAEYLPFATHPLQGALAVVARRDRPELRRLVYRIDVRRTWGQCWLVGAGPGDPELLTRRAWHIITHADVVVHDALIDERVLAGYSGERINVGKRKGAHTLPQEEINELLYQLVTSGKTVARLKNGDVGIFGRGGEEYRYLRERLASVSIVPGVTAASAAAADAGMALTQRGVARELVIMSGHDAQRCAPADATYAVYMGATERVAVADTLSQRGLPPSTAALIVAHASMPQATCREMRLDELAHGESETPAVIIAGHVAAGRDHQPRALYTGLDVCAARVPMRLVPYPLITTRPLMCAASWQEYDALVFTSKTAVASFCERWEMPAVPVFAVGPATAGALEQRGVRVAGMPARADAEALAELLAASAYEHIGYPCSARSHNALHAMPRVHAVPIYTTDNLRQPIVDLRQFDGIVFTSHSTVESFFALYTEVPASLACFVFGAPTCRALCARGVREEQIIVVPAQ